MIAVIDADDERITAIRTSVKGGVLTNPSELKESSDVAAIQKHYRILPSELNLLAPPSNLSAAEQFTKQQQSAAKVHAHQIGKEETAKVDEYFINAVTARIANKH